jgi:hypothetical protein
MRKPRVLLTLVAGALAVAMWYGKRPTALTADDTPTAIERIELVPPQGYELYGGADLESRIDGAGNIFVAATGETSRGFGGLMWLQKPDGKGGWTSTPIDLGELYPGGRGSLSVESDGQLYLTQWGEKSQAFRLRIPAWKPHAR